MNWEDIIKAMGEFDEDILDTIELVNTHGYTYSLSIEERKRFDEAIATLRDLFKNYED
jgi:hypothetical protein|tara:strand:+ start:154 stop:327 length:174 start_codon:yes stop_codon:yes gene_type:complete